MPTIPSRPFEMECPTDRLALIVIDMQRDFIEHGGYGASLGNDVARLQAIIPAVRSVIDAARAAGICVIHTKEAHRHTLCDCPPSKRKRHGMKMGIGDPGPLGRLLVSGEPGNDIVPELYPMDGEVVIEKPGKGAFYATDIERHLREAGATHLIFCGVTTDVCVQTTMREAADRGFYNIIVEDGTESYFPEFKRATIDMMTAQGGIIACAVDSKDLVSALAPALVPP